MRFCLQSNVFWCIVSKQCEDYAKYAFTNVCILSPIFVRVYMQLVTLLKKRTNRMNPILRISMIWFLGLILGCYIASSENQSYLLRIRQACFAQHSLFLALLGNVILFGSVILIARYFGKNKTLLLVFFKAFAFSLCGNMVSMAYGSAGWLVAILLLFSNFGINVAFLLLVVRVFLHKNDVRIRAHVPCFITVLIVILFDHFLISPFTTLIFT